MPGLSYSSLVVLILLALTFIVVVYMRRGRWRAVPGGLQSLQRSNQRTQREIYHDVVVPLMLYEEKYPAFGEILVLVLDRFPLEEFLKDDEFETAIQFLAAGVYGQPAESELESKMCAVVRAFVSDPDVEYQCREALHPLVDRFLAELRKNGSQRSA